MTPHVAVPVAPLRAVTARVVAALAIAVSLVVVTAAPASAHASLESTTPADGAALDEAPEELVLDFNENVTVPTAGVRVFDASGEPLAGVETSGGKDPSIVRASLPGDLGDDTYIVTWRAISADGHPIRGAFVFTVGNAAAASDELVADLFAGGDDTAVSVAATIARWLEYALVLFAAGGALFLVRVHRDGPVDAGRLARPLVRVTLAGVVVTLVGVGLQAALTAGGGIAGALDGAALSDVVLSGYGASAGARVLGLALLLAGLVAGPQRVPVLTLAGAAVATASFALSGHTLTTEPRWLVLGADIAHLLAAAVWFGGLGLLLVVLRAARLADDPVAAGRLVARFSALAAGAVVVVGVAGLALTWAEVRVPRALTSTAYGWTLVAKLVLVAAVGVAGVYNNRRLVPVIARVTHGAADLGDGVVRRVPAGGADGSAGDAGTQLAAAGSAWRTLRRTVGLEVVGVAAVLAVTSVLVYLPPAAEAAGVTGVFSTYEEMGDYLVNLTVDPNRAGANEVHLYLLTEQGRPAADAVEDLRLELSLPEQDIGPIERTPSVAGPGHWVLTGRELSLSGRWEIEVIAPVSRFEQLNTTVPVVVGG